MSVQDTAVFYLQFLRLLCMVAAKVLLLLLAQVLRPVRQYMDGKMEDVMRVTTMQPSDYCDTIYSVTYVRRFFYANFIDLFRTARLYGNAPNPEVITLNGKSVQLLSPMKAGRPLVLNFGSCT